MLIALQVASASDADAQTMKVFQGTPASSGISLPGRAGPQPPRRGPSIKIVPTPSIKIAPTLPPTAGRTPIVPSCGALGRPPCHTGPRAPSIVIVTPPPCGTKRTKPCPKDEPPPRAEVPTDPPPTRCGKDQRCPEPGRPIVVTTPAPGGSGGGLAGGYVASLPRFAERPAAAPDGDLQRFPRQVLVLIDQDRPAALEDALASDYNLRRLQGETLTLIGARSQLYAIPDGRSIDAVIGALSADQRVRLAQSNFSYRRNGETAKAALPLQYAHVKISLASAHQRALGRGVLVAVIDSAIDDKHPDLAGRVVRSFDAVGQKTSPDDGHGTAVAGIIGAQGRVPGVAPMVELLAVRAFSTPDRKQPASTSSAVVLRSVEWSIVNGARIVNMSFAGPRDPAVQAIVEAALDRSAVIVAAAGNGGPNAPPAFPAAYPGVIAVTALDATDTRYTHANRGPYIVVAAPGVDIIAPADGGRHAFLSGTSFAAAHVSGVVALLLEREGGLRPRDIATAITDTAVDLGAAGRDDDFGFGRVDALAAIEALTRRSASR